MEKRFTVASYQIEQTKELLLKVWTVLLMGLYGVGFFREKMLAQKVVQTTDDVLPDAVISDNNIASYFLFAGSDGLMNEMVMQQWQK